MRGKSSGVPLHARRMRRGFTLLELLIALTIMSVAMTVVVATFTVTLRGYQRGNELIDSLHHGDFVMEQLVSALRSMAFFPNAPEKYGFWLEDESEGRYPADTLSFVTSGTAFLPRDSHFANGLHRIFISIDDNDDGDPAVTINVAPHLMDPEEWEDDNEPWHVSTVVKGLECRTYNMREEDWEDKWEDTNAIPSLVEVTIFMEPIEPGEPPVTMSRVVEIPLGPVVQNAVEFREADQEDGQAAQDDLRTAEETETEGGTAVPDRDGGTIQVPERRRRDAP